jgi:hypothetical protein
MKAIITQAVIEGIRARKDRSLGLTITTPELSAQEKATFMELQGIPVDLKITPLDEEQVEEQIIDKDLNQKTQSQRIRGCLYILFRQNPEGMTWKEYYRNKTEKYITKLKSMIDE